MDSCFRIEAVPHESGFYILRLTSDNARFLWGDGKFRSYFGYLDKSKPKEGLWPTREEAEAFLLEWKSELPTETFAQYTAERMIK